MGVCLCRADMKCKKERMCGGRSVYVCGCRKEEEGQEGRRGKGKGGKEIYTEWECAQRKKKR